MNRESNLSENLFNEEYANFQNWNPINFGELSKHSTKVFDAELKKTSIDFNVGSKVLEVGFGNGEFLAYARSKQWDVVGTELNEGLCEIAENKGFNVVKTGDLASFEGASFDLIVAFDVLEHMEQSEIVVFLKAVKSVLSKNGVFLARFPNADSPLGLATQHSDITHVTAIGTGKIKHLTNLANLKLISCGGEAEVTFHQNLFLRLYKLITFFIRRLIDLFIYFLFYRRKYLLSTNLIVVLAK